MVEDSHPILAGLNAAQRRAVLHETGSLLVLAGPGSGKTRVIVSRVAYGIAAGRVAAERVLAVTFTSRAADEMKARVAQLVPAEAAPRIGTFHWICHALLRRDVHRLGYRRNFRLLDPSESRRIARQVVREFGAEDRVDGTALLRAISAAKNGAPAAGLHPHPAMAALVRTYDQRLRILNALDLDDLLHLSVRLLREDEQARRLWAGMYDEIVVDEYQDVNPVQHELLAQLRPGVRTLVAVGDEDQAIYGWRHADVQGILRFHRTFPGAETIKLEETYRSSKHILRAARALVRHNEDRIDKRLRTAMPAGERPTCYGAADEVDEADWIAGEIGRLAAREGRPLSDFAVLYRVNAQSRAIEDALVRAGLPYAIHGGSRFYERREVGHALAYLRLALDAADDDATLYLLRDIPGVGPRRVETFRRLARPGDAPLADVLAGGRAAEVAPGRVGEDVRRTALNIQAIRGSRHLSLAEVTGRAVRLTLADWEARGAADPAGVEENLHELRSLAEEFSLRRGSLRTFLDRLILRGEDVPDRPGVTCMSLHAAKGTEYHVVFLAGLEEGLLPHRRSLDARETIEEERRLCYVGMTRARERLLLSYAHFRLLGGQALVGRRSRFLGEIGTNNLIQRASRRLAATPRLPSVLPGQRVVHVRWREGTVVEVEGSGRETMVTIDFDEVGQRRLQLCYAPLTAPATRRRETRVG